MEDHNISVKHKVIQDLKNYILYSIVITFIIAHYINFNRKHNASNENIS